MQTNKQTSNPLNQKRLLVISHWKNKGQNSQCSHIWTLQNPQGIYYVKNVNDFIYRCKAYIIYKAIAKLNFHFMNDFRGPAATTMTLLLFWSRDTNMAACMWKSCYTSSELLFMGFKSPFIRNRYRVSYY